MTEVYINLYVKEQIKIKLITTTTTTTNTGTGYKRHIVTYLQKGQSMSHRANRLTIRS